MTRPATVPQHKVLGPYRLGLLLGEGGMGEVYKAFDDRLGRWVAAKRLRVDATAESRARFRREARALAQLGHPAIVQIFDIVEEDAGDWTVMELVEGSTLAELSASGPFDVGLAIDYARQIASALEAAHARGIVHRDLKTENVMALPSGYIKVLDFGLARDLAPHSVTAVLEHGLAPKTADAKSRETSISRPGRIAGTPRAMSPEQALGQDFDGRSDLFALGVLLYEISTARSPFSARTLEETLHRVIHHQPPPVRRLNPKIPPGLSELVDRLLDKDPGRRPGTAAAVEAELVTIAATDPVYRVSSRDLSKVTIRPSIEAPGLGVTTADVPISGASQDEAVVTTLLSADLVGRGRPAGGPGDQAAEASRQLHRQLTRKLLEEHGGREVDLGDGRLLLFDRPWHAVSYALAYQASVQSSTPRQPAMRQGSGARIGIHLGEVILHHNTPGDVSLGARPLEVEGPATPNVTRLMSLAVAGQTLLTRAAYEMARRGAAREGDQGLEWRAHGRYRFRGLSGDVEIFEVGEPGVAPMVAPSGSHEAWRRPDPALPETSSDPPASGWTRSRTWSAPEPPEHPYPVLLPYAHPDFMAGRDQEIARLRRLLEMPVPILGLSATSGVGKSSLLLGGLVPALRAAGVPVALVRHPAEAGVASRLIGDLLDGAEPVDDRDVSGFVDRLAEVERLAGRAPILVLDQFEDVLREDAPRDAVDGTRMPRDDVDGARMPRDAASARATLGVLMAASVARRPGLEAPVCRWLIVYRQELYGRLNLWLSDVLVDARAAGVAGIEALPHDVSHVERFHGMTLPPLATPSPAAGDALDEATRVFLAAIEKPLAAEREVAWPWHFPAGHAERLARAFAEARLARPDAPLAPELQVVLAHLLAAAGPDGRVTVPEDPGPLIDRALEDHLRRALEAVFPEGAADSTRRARALLALRALCVGPSTGGHAIATGRRDHGLRPADLARAIGDGGEEILEELATPLTRLVVVREASDGPRWVLAHDRMAQAVVRLVAEEGRRGKLLLDTELLALRRFVDLRTALYRSGEVKASTRVSRRRFRRLREHAEALLWDDEARAWFAACRQRRRADLRRRSALAASVALVLGLVGQGAWTWARRLADLRALREQVAQGEPETAFEALEGLASRPGADRVLLLDLLRRRDAPMDVLELGLGGLDGPERSAAVLRAVEVALPWVEETPRDSKLIANLVWALDYAPGRDPPFAERARALRDRVLTPLRRLRPPPGLPDLEDPDWVTVPAGTFLMGLGPGEEGQDIERPRHEVSVSGFRMLRHEVTNAEYRRLVPDHHPDAGDRLPARNVNWYAAYTYAAWLGGRLPTEAEWEYAARAGCPYVYCARDGSETTAGTVAWTLESSRDGYTGLSRLWPVMRLEPNPWGFHDILGNIWEWTADWSGGYPAGPRHDPWGPAVSSNGTRMIRGGAFSFVAERSRVTHRTRGKPGTVEVKRGLRPVLQSVAPTARLGVPSTTRRP